MGREPGGREGEEDGGTRFALYTLGKSRLP